MRQPIHLMFAILLLLSQFSFGQDAVRPLADLQKQVEVQNQKIELLQQRLESQQGLIENLSQRDQTFQNQLETPDTRFPLIERFTDNPVSDSEAIDFLKALQAVGRRTVNGRIHIDYWGNPLSTPGINIIENGDPDEDPDNEFLYRRIRLGIRGKVRPGNMSYRLEIEFSGQDGSQFRDAWIGWDDLVCFQTVRLGNQKRPYGWGHLNSSNFMVFLERPFIVDAFNEDSRRFGLASYGVSDDLAYNWQYGTYLLPQVQDVGSVIADPVQSEVAGRFANTWWYDDDGRRYAHWGIAGTVAFPDGNAPNTNGEVNQAQFETRPEGRAESDWLDTGQIAGAEAYQILGLESVFNYGRFQVAGELMNLWLQREPATGDDIFLHGGYVYFSYFLTGEYIPWNRELGVIGRVQPHQDFFHSRTDDCETLLGIGAWQAALRLSYADLSDEQVLGGIGQSATFAVNWYWNSHSRLQFNYLVGRIDERLAALNTGPSVVVSGDYQIAGLRCMIDF